MKKNKQQLAQEGSEILQERIKNKTESDERKQEKKNEVLKNITEIGIWQNINEITSELALLKTKKEKYFGLKKQINIHKETVTLHNEDKHLLQFSSKGKLHDIEKLKKNLLTILQLRNETMAIFQDPESFIGKEIYHVWTDEITGIDTKYKGKIMSYSNDTFKVNALFDLTVQSSLDHTTTTPFLTPNFSFNVNKGIFSIPIFHLCIICLYR